MQKFQSLIIDLILSIKENNLENTKKNVELLNNYPLWNEYEDIQLHGLKYNLNSALSIGILAQQVHGNDSVMYAIDNLNHIFNRDKIKWDLTIQKMEVYNEAIIRDFILNSIKDVNILQDEDKVSSLLHLAVIVGDNIIIKKIKNSLLELNKEV